MSNTSIRRIATATTALALAGALAFGVANAGPQIYVQQSGISAAGGDPNVLTNVGAFTIGVVGGTFTLQNPLLVIVGVYDGIGTPSISFGTTAPLATVGTYGLGHHTATLTTGQNVWAQLGLPVNGETSESFTNWSTFGDVANGFTAPTSFTLYAFAIDTSLSSTSPITVSESGAANGSFIVGFGCKDTSCSPGKILQSVFTNTGLVKTTTVPEPGVLALFGAGLLGGALLIGRRRARQG